MQKLTKTKRIQAYRTCYVKIAQFNKIQNVTCKQKSVSRNK